MMKASRDKARVSGKLASVKRRLQEIEEAIAEVERRLPAHSVKPGIMHELFDLEDERDRLRRHLATGGSGLAKSRED